MISLIIRRLVCMHIDYYLSAAGGHPRGHPLRRRNSLRQPLPPTGLAHPLTSRLSHHPRRGSATDKILEMRTILWIMGDKRPGELTRSRQGAETQRFRLLSTITRRVNHLNLCFPCHLPVLCVLASWRLCVNCRFRLIAPPARPLAKGPRGTRARWPWPVLGFARASAGRRFVCRPGLSGIWCAPTHAASTLVEKAALAS